MQQQFGRPPGPRHQNYGIAAAPGHWSPYRWGRILGLSASGFQGAGGSVLLLRLIGGAPGLLDALRGAWDSVGSGVALELWRAVQARPLVRRLAHAVALR